MYRNFEFRIIPAISPDLSTSTSGAVFEFLACSRQTVFDSVSGAKQGSVRMAGDSTAAAPKSLKAVEMPTSEDQFCE
jgi:hypothetical protein